MRVRLFGPVEVVGDDGPVAVEVPKEQALLGVLALRAGHEVPTDHLVATLWGDQPPATAAKTLQSHISRLRRLLGAATIATGAGGYTLCVAEHDVDVHRFAALIAGADQALADGDPVEASHLASEALELWRGEPFVAIADRDVAAGQLVRLHELRVLAHERRAEAELALGHHAELVGELEALVAEQPFRERLWVQLMVALYRCDRQADALRAFQRVRRLLVDELGIEPSATLIELEERILRHDLGLDLEPPPPPTNLPARVGALVGRDAQVRTVDALLDVNRLVTLTGPGGVGKTRLALEVAWGRLHGYPDGCWWIDLQPVGSPADVVGAVVGALGMAAPPGVDATGALGRFVRRRRLLLVVDNCEHLVGAARSMVEDLLAAGPGVVVLATSRIPLGTVDERCVAVPALGLPPVEATDPDQLRRSDAVALFVTRSEERTGRAVPSDDLAPIADITRQLDGLPFAIELAAARTSVLSPNQIRSRLGEILDLEWPAEDPRHRSLAASLRWSHDLLDDDDQRLLRRLAVFPADFDLAAVEAVASDVEVPLAHLDHLVAACLVAVTPGARPTMRYRLLETVREFARARAEAVGELDAACDRHAVHYLAVARAATLAGGGSSATSGTPRLVADEHNLRAALEWFRAGRLATEALEVADPLTNLWYQRGENAAVAELLQSLLATAGEVEPAVRAQALGRLAWPLALGGDAPRAFVVLEEALELHRRTGSDAGEAADLSALAHLKLLFLGDIDAALPRYEEALAAAARAGSAGLRARTQVELAHALVMADRPGAGPLLDEAEPVLSDADEQVWLAHLYLVRSLDLYRLGLDHELSEIARRQLDHSRRAESPGFEQLAYVALAVYHLGQGELSTAADHGLRAARSALDQGNLLQLGVALQAAAWVVAAEGRDRAAARVWGAGAALCPTWPMFARRYGPALAGLQARLGDRFDPEVDVGAHLDLDEAIALLVADPD